MTAVIGIVYLEVERMFPNPWNPNKMDDEMLRKEAESIREFGFVDPVTVRSLESGYQIIDGEHRWRVAKQLGLKQIPCVVLEVDDTEAEQLTIVLNDLRGKPNEERLSALVRDLANRRSTVDLERVLPYKRERLAEMIANRKVDFDWDALRRPKADPVSDSYVRWVERIYRIPMAAAEVIDGAIAEVRANEDITDDWRALELICADYMSGAE